MTERAFRPTPNAGAKAEEPLWTKYAYQRYVEIGRICAIIMFLLPEVSQAKSSPDRVDSVENSLAFVLFQRGFGWRICGRGWASAVVCCIPLQERVAAQLCHRGESCAAAAKRAAVFEGA